MSRLTLNQQSENTLILSQGSVDDWEIACLDDGSQDDTAEIVRRLSEDTKKVRLVVDTENKGIHRSLVDLYLNTATYARNILRWLKLEFSTR